MISSAGKAKDSLNNIRETAEFVVNIVTEDFVAQMNQCSGEFPPDVDEFVISGLTPLAAETVRPARIAESKIHMECRLLQIVEVSAKPLGGSLVLGEVKLFHIADELVENGQVNTGRVQAVGRMAGSQYVRTTDLFNLLRP